MERTVVSTAPDRRRTLLTLIIHAVILVSTAITAVTGILYGASSSQDGDNMIGWGYFKAFTMDSNILAGICAFFVVLFAVRALVKGKETPRWVILFQHTAAAGLFLTIVTVTFFLAPMDVLDGKSYFGMFSDDLLIYHLTNPLLAILAFVFLRREYRLKRKDCLWALLPISVYIVVYVLMVVVLGKWDDFYGFSFGGRYYLTPLVVAVMLGLTYLMARLLAWMNGKAQDRK